jgi:hypothetical protein
MLIAATGVTLALVLWPATNQRAPTITPTRLVQLYSMAGARPERQAEPDSASNGTRSETPFTISRSVPQQYRCVVRRPFRA